MMTIEHATIKDVAEMAAIEAVSYPPLEGASKEGIEKRVKAFPECFWILKENHAIKAFVNGMRTNEKDLVDAMYDHASMHDPKGDWQMIFSVVTSPSERGKGYAGRLLEKMINDSKVRGCAGVVLTCKEHLLSFYGRFGFVSEGISPSTHGNVTWYQMRLTF